MSLEVWAEYAKQGLTPHKRGCVERWEVRELEMMVDPAGAGMCLNSIRYGLLVVGFPHTGDRSIA